MITKRRSCGVVLEHQQLPPRTPKLGTAGATTPNRAGNQTGWFPRIGTNAELPEQLDSASVSGSAGVRCLPGFQKFQREAKPRWPQEVRLTKSGSLPAS